MKEAMQVVLLVLLLVAVGTLMLWGLFAAGSCWANGGTWVPTAWPRKCL